MYLIKFEIKLRKLYLTVYKIIVSTVQKFEQGHSIQLFMNSNGMASTKIGWGNHPKKNSFILLYSVFILPEFSEKLSKKLDIGE